MYITTLVCRKREQDVENGHINSHSLGYDGCAFPSIGSKTI